VEREERRLDGERDREAEEDPDVVARPGPCVTPTATTEASISREPTIVYTTNVSVATWRRAPPQTPTSTYSGMSIASKET
jgi:hypothetical protein